VLFRSKSNGKSGKENTPGRHVSYNPLYQDQNFVTCFLEKKNLIVHFTPQK